VMFAVVALLLASLGPVVVAGHQIALNVVGILFMVPLSLGMALTIRISFLIGARDIQSAKLGARSSVILILAIAVFYAVLLYLFAEPIAGVYTKEADVIAVAVTLLGFGAMFQIADVLQVVAISALRGYKDTRIPMYIMLASFWGIGIPLGYALAYKDWLVPAMGAPGFWIGLIAGLSHAAFWLLIRLYIFSGRDLSTTLKAAADPN
ncbi:MAG: MATE family efflux transporter, partial [Reinekea sp.]|nr:MATE family efflux transporter [Reinekea sp.]